MDLYPLHKICAVSQKCVTCWRRNTATAGVETSLQKWAIISLLGVCLLLSACANIVRPNYSQNLTELRSGAYSLDPEHAYVTFRVGHLGLSTIVGRFNVVAGSLDFDPNNISAMSLQGIIEANSIDVNNKDLEKRLQDDAWFNASVYPQIAFTSTSVERGDNGIFLIAGKLSMRGVVKDLLLQARFNGGADNILTGKYTLGFSANTQLIRSDFGMDAFAALVADKIEVELHGEFQRN